MHTLVNISKKDEILPEYQQTPIGLLLEYHNLERPLESYENAQLLVGMCMDNRNHLRIPDNFSFIIRAGGANFIYSEFYISFAISVGGIQHIALIGHTNCGMVNLISHKDKFIKGLVDKAGWNEESARDHFAQFAPKYQIENEIDFILGEAKRLRQSYPKVCIAPMLYKVEDNRLYLIDEKENDQQ